MFTEVNELFISHSLRALNVPPKMSGSENSKGKFKANKNCRERENKYKQIYHQPMKSTK